MDRDLVNDIARSTDIKWLVARALELSTADKFRLAAALCDFGKPDIAEAIGTRACQEIQLAQLFGRK
jgi:hypothetical protein